MNEVDALCMFNEAQQALNQLEAKVRGITEKRDSYKLPSEQHERESKSLRAELEVAQKKHPDLAEQVRIFEVSDDELGSVTNDWNPQVQQKIDQVAQLRVEMDVVKAKTNKWRGRMDRRASEKEAARVQLTSAEVQLRAAKEKVEPQSRKVGELQSRLNLAASERKTMLKELEMAKSVAAVVKTNADESGPI
ncbi:uncharacterized protein [Nicotiana tomentosiformis]|uniref:uncharacterized protein n=1 Tax=Nicotiana tomentosiformis TaxID=4098 RepID=UPI00388CD9B5